MKSVPLLIATIVGSMLLVIAVAVFFSGNSGPLQVEETLLSAGATKITGATESAQVQVVEFSDFQCPACRSAEPAVEQLLATYGEEVEFIYRHFPLQSHRWALDAASASEVAFDQGKFWELHYLLFERQPEWSVAESKDDLVGLFEQYFDELEIDKTDLASRIEGEDIRSRVLDDVALGNTIGVDSTPTFFVNGQQTTAPQLLSTVESLIDESQ